MPLLQSNIAKLGLDPCAKCGSYNSWVEECESHWPKLTPSNYTHFCLRGQWYVVPQKYTDKLLSILEVDAAMQIHGAMYKPRPTRIQNLTDLMSLCRKMGATDDEMDQVFLTGQVNRMRSRVFKKLVRGR